uniref:Uncharacterized protein n=1 Tax=Schistosoma japonicum TaxID=6182 RepID=Q5BY09_SCHJA|nr:unknown [Schistosoma japonicum]
MILVLCVFYKKLMKSLLISARINQLNF